MASLIDIFASSSSVRGPVDAPSQLTINDLPETFDLLRRHGYSGTSYYDLGLFLGLFRDTLDAITSNTKGDTESCLRECLKAWLQKADNVEKKAGPTIYSLVSALRRTGEKGVADGIDMEKHPACTILACYASKRSLLSVLPRFAVYLYEAGLIGVPVLFFDYIADKILSIEIKKAVCCDYRKLEMFADVLCKDPVTAEIGRDIMSEYREAYGSDDENGLKIYLPKIVTSEFMKMRIKFWQTFIKVGSIMMSDPHSPTLDIKRVVIACDMTLKPQLDQCKDIRSIVQLVRDNSSLDDISMLKYLVTEFNIKEAEAVIKEYKEAIEELKTKLHRFLKEKFLKASSLLGSLTIVVDKDTEESVLKDVQRLSLALLPLYVKLNIIRDDGGMRKVLKKESSTDTFVVPTVQSKDTTLTTELPAGTTEKDEDQVMLLQEKVESIQKQLEEEQEHHEKEKQFHEQVIKKYEEEILQQKRKLIQNEERIATLTEQQEEVTGDLKHKTEQYEELRSENELTNKQLEEQQKKLKEEIQTFFSLIEQKEVALKEKEKLQINIDDLQQKLELQQANDHKEVSVQCDFTITQSEQAPVKQKEETEILQETETVHTCTYISKVKDSNDEFETQIETENKEIQATQTTLDKEIQFNYLVPSQDNLEGLSESQIAGKKLFLVQGDKPQLMNWEEYGLRISVAEDSLSASETVEVSVLALVGGHFKFPDNTRLVSAVYAISTSPLLKSLRIEMQHCIDLSDPSLSKYLKFAVAPVHTASLPYQFSIIEGGEFPAYQRYGWIERSKFCQLAIVGEEEEETGGGRNEERNGEEDGDSGDEGGKGKGETTGGEGQGAGGQEGGTGGGVEVEHQQQNEDKKQIEEQSQVAVCTESTNAVSTHSTGIPEATVYAGQVFYQKEERRDIMTFTAARDLNLLRQFIKKEYSHPEIDQSITFKLKSPKRRIKLKFDEEQAKPTTGWEIIPHLVPCQIEEHEILGFGDISTTVPPSCLVSIYAENSPHTVSILRYSVPLKGVHQKPKEIIINRSLRTKLSSDHVSVNRSPTAPPPPQNSTFRSDIAHRVMTECTSSIKDCGIDINFLVDKLLEQKILNSREKRKITARETHDDKMDELLHIILSSIRMNGKVFGIFIDILREEDTLRTIALADTLMDKYKE